MCFWNCYHMGLGILFIVFVFTGCKSPLQISWAATSNKEGTCYLPTGIGFRTAQGKMQECISKLCVEAKNSNPFFLIKNKTKQNKQIFVHSLQITLLIQLLSRVDSILTLAPLCSHNSESKSHCTVEF